MSKATEILLIRHGETEWNAKGLVQGHTNIPLNDHGIKQAKDLAEKLLLSHPEITAIYSSDLDRAYTTALISAERLNLSVKSKHFHLREIKYGEAEGISHDEKRARF